jgi:hypothetical protein
VKGRRGRVSSCVFSSVVLPPLLRRAEVSEQRGRLLVEPEGGLEGESRGRDLEAEQQGDGALGRESPGMGAEVRGQGAKGREERREKGAESRERRVESRE